MTPADPRLEEQRELTERNIITPLRNQLAEAQATIAQLREQVMALNDSVITERAKLNHSRQQVEQAEAALKGAGFELDNGRWSQVHP